MLFSVLNQATALDIDELVLKFGPPRPMRVHNSREDAAGNPHIFQSTVADRVFLRPRFPSGHCATEHNGTRGKHPDFSNNQ